MNYKPVIDVILWYYPIIMVFGFAGNLLAFVVFSQPKLSKTSFAVYFRFLVVSDSITLLQAINDFHIYRYGRAVADYSAFVCTAYHYVVDSTTLISASMYAVLSIDRILQIAFINRFGILQSKWLQVCVGLAVCLACFFIDVPEAFGYWTYQVQTNVNDNTSSLLNDETNETSIESLDAKCVWVDPNNIFSLFYLAMVSILPFIIMTTSSILMARIVLTSKQRVTSNLTTNQSTTNKANTLKSKDVRFAITLIVLNVCFLCCNTPINILYIMSSYTTVEWDLPNVILSSLFYTNLTLVFPANFLLSSLFKNELMRFIQPALRLFGVRVRTQQTGQSSITF